MKSLLSPLRRRLIGRSYVLSLIGIIGLALALRIAIVGQSLFGDELYTYQIVDKTSLHDLFHGVRYGENTPPLYYAAAWACAKLVDPRLGIRLPSLMFGTVTVGVLGELGRRTLGAGAGLAAAAFWAVSPFAVFYSTEGRAYATATFFAVTSTLALVIALRRLDGRARWWLVYGLSSTALLYSHYTGVFVLVAQLAWAARTHRIRLQPLLVTSVAMVLAFLPWMIVRRANAGLEALGTLYPLSPGSFFRVPIQTAAGHPFLSLANVPGAIGLIVLGLVTAAAAVRWANPALKRSPRLATHDYPLVALLAAAAPLGLIVYRVVSGSSLYAPRNLLVSLPYVYLAFGALLFLPRWRLAPAAIGLAFAVLAVGTLRQFEPEGRRTPWKAVATYVEHERRGQPVVEYDLFPGHDPLGRRPLRTSLTANFDQPTPLISASSADRNTLGAILAARGGGLLVVAQIPSLPGVPPPPDLGPEVIAIDRQTFRGFADVAVFRYSVRRNRAQAGDR